MLSPLDADISNQGCDPHGNLTIIIHGWNEKIHKTSWIDEMIGKFLGLRGNCVIFVDYSRFSSGPYPALLPHFNGISKVLSKKLADLPSPEKIVMFGFSFGSRLAFDAGTDCAEQGKKFDKIFACDPAGPGFSPLSKNPQKAAKFVQCINTSQTKGTTIYNCHQNWRFSRLQLSVKKYLNYFFVDLVCVENIKLELSGVL